MFTCTPKIIVYMYVVLVFVIKWLLIISHLTLPCCSFQFCPLVLSTHILISSYPIPILLIVAMLKLLFLSTRNCPASHQNRKSNLLAILRNNNGVTLQNNGHYSIRPNPPDYHRTIYRTTCKFRIFGSVH